MMFLYLLSNAILSTHYVSLDDGKSVRLIEEERHPDRFRSIQDALNDLTEEEKQNTKTCILCQHDLPEVFTVHARHGARQHGALVDAHYCDACSHPHFCADCLIQGDSGNHGQRMLDAFENGRSSNIRCMICRDEAPTDSLHVFGRLVIRPDGPDNDQALQRVVQAGDAKTFQQLLMFASLASLAFYDTESWRHGGVDEHFHSRFPWVMQQLARDGWCINTFKTIIYAIREREGLRLPTKEEITDIRWNTPMGRLKIITLISFFASIGSRTILPREVAPIVTTSLGWLYGFNSQMNNIFQLNHGGFNLFDQFWPQQLIWRLENVGVIMGLTTLQRLTSWALNTVFTLGIASGIMTALNSSEFQRKSCTLFCDGMEGLMMAAVAAGGGVYIPPNDDDDSKNWECSPSETATFKIMFILIQFAMFVGYKMNQHYERRPVLNWVTGEQIAMALFMIHHATSEEIALFSQGEFAVIVTMAMTALVTGALICIMAAMHG